MVEPPSPLCFALSSSAILSSASTTFLLLSAIFNASIQDYSRHALKRAAGHRAAVSRMRTRVACPSSSTPEVRRPPKYGKRLARPHADKFVERIRRQAGTVELPASSNLEPVPNLF